MNMSLVEHCSLVSLFFFPLPFLNPQFALNSLFLPTFTTSAFFWLSNVT